MIELTTSQEKEKEKKRKEKKRKQKEAVKGHYHDFRIWQI